MEKVLKRKLTETEFSAAESMESEHAGYGSTKFYLKTILPVNGKNHLKSIGDEAASVLMHKDVVLTYSSESHNSPSYVCAHPGAATGVGGNIGDQVVATGTKPEVVSEARRQGDPLKNEYNDPIKQHTDETTKGIADYANAMGIPHGDGSIKYNKGFAGNNLVNVMAISVCKKERLLSNKIPIKEADKYVGIYLGKASDTTGIGGTKFASFAIDMQKSDLNEKAVQDPDPHLREAIYRGFEKVIDLAIEQGWIDKISMKDMGAAGLLCSSLEQLHSNIGVIINGDLIPTNSKRSAIELLEAETQERFFIYVHKNYAKKVLEIFNEEIGLSTINIGACAKIVAKCNLTGNYVFLLNGVKEVDIPAYDLMHAPIMYRKVEENQLKFEKVPKPIDLKKEIKFVLESLNFKSDHYIFSNYDKHVRSTNIINRGQACATLRLHHLFENKVAYSHSFDSNCNYGIISPKFQAQDSFIRGCYKMATVGCSVIGVTNNANYGRSDVPKEMWEFVEGQKGVALACNNWKLENKYLSHIGLEDNKITVNSGNVSLNKANKNKGTAINPTTILGLIGWTNKPKKYATWQLKGNSKLFLIGSRSKELGGSDYLSKVFGKIKCELFKIDYKKSFKEVKTIINCVRKGLIVSANIIEEGGICNTIAEMVANTPKLVDVTIDLNEKFGDYLNYSQKLFSEKYGVIVEVINKEQFLQEIQGIDCFEIGFVSKGEGILRFLADKKIKFSQQKIRKLYFEKMQKNLRGERCQLL